LALTQIASAADLPRKAPAAPPPPPVYNWTGLYVGGNVGYGWGVSSDLETTVADPFGIGLVALAAAGGLQRPDVRPDGVIGGGQIGYNWMFAPSWVFGVVADFQGSGMKESATTFVSIPGFAASNQSNSVKIDWFGTLRGKLGYAANNWLFLQRAAWRTVTSKQPEGSIFVLLQTSLSLAPTLEPKRVGL
jgi:outer membrane immunogenic protein